MGHANRLNGKELSHDSSHTTSSTKVASCGIAFMAKASVPGLTKTRLVPPLTLEQAAALNTAFLQDVAENLMLAARLATPRADIAGYAAYCPAGAQEFFHRTLPAAIGLIDSALPNFGDCLFQTIQQILARGHVSAVVLNADSPTLPTAFLIETAAMLSLPGDRAVLGPSRDGGYYLLGLKTAHRRLFDDIAWSTEWVAEQTLQRACEIGLEVRQLPFWYDVDDIECLRRLRAELCNDDSSTPGNAAGQPYYPRQTAALLHNLWRDNHLDRRSSEPRQIERMRA
jgi:uncharacterized protein